MCPGSYEAVDVQPVAASTAAALSITEPCTLRVAVRLFLTDRLIDQPGAQSLDHGLGRQIQLREIAGGRDLQEQPLGRQREHSQPVDFP